MYHTANIEAFLNTQDLSDSEKAEINSRAHEAAEYKGQFSSARLTDVLGSSALAASFIEAWERDASIAAAAFTEE